ncbi:MAG: endonuclease/exonuclease/phosphatase family protein [Chitinophagaceae bacterium]|nr:endonuclease/exonuclease/phosphatase family protein [Chitinophagaceae bacterium]
MSSKLYFALMFSLIVKTSNAQQNGSLKVMTYNIYNGFDWGKDSIRQKETAAFITAQHPDIVALQELCGFTEDRLKSFAANWGHSYAYLLKENGYPVGITSNQPIQLISKIMNDGMGHGMLHTQTHGISFFVVHLNPGNYKLRQKESALIRQYMKQSLNTQDSLYMVLGDFNSHSPLDAFLDKNRSRLLKMYQKSDADKAIHKNLMNNYFDYSVISSFLGYPLIDVCEQKIQPEDRFSFPTPILIGTSKKADEIVPSRERIDFIFTSPKLATKCTEATIINSGIADKLSDHFPVIATFNKN